MAETPAHPRKRPADKASAPSGGPSFLSALRATLHASKLYLALLGLIAGVPTAVLSIATHWGWPIWVASFACVAPAVLILLWLVPSWSERQNRRRAIACGINGEVKDPEYFRLTPFDSTSDFRRADNAHEKVYAWLVGNAAPLLYLSGASGSGKSSIISGWVLPKLAREGISMYVVGARVVGNPMSAVTRELLKPGAVWERPPSEGKHCLRDLLERAARKVAPRKLLLVLDQFEEFLILAEEEQREAFATVLRSLAESPLSNLQVLMVLRSDYRALIADLRLPPFEHDSKEVPAFSERDAMDFLRKSGLRMSDVIEAELREEAREVEQTPGLMRPITVNLFGLVLRRFEALPKNYRKGMLLRSHLLDLIQRREIRDFAAPVLRCMLTGNGTKAPVACTDVATRLGFDPYQVRGCLVQLANDGVVRELDRNDGIWEISHDFIAALYYQILAGWRASAWRRVRPWVVGGGIGLWLIIFLGVASVLRDYPHQHALSELGFSWGSCSSTTDSLFNPWTSCVELTAKPGLTGSEFSAALPHIRALHRPLALNLTDAQIGNDALDALSGLDVESLDLTGTLIWNVNVLREMHSLRSLGLHRTHVTNIAALKGLIHLESLNLWQTPVEDFDPLKGLTALRELDLRYTRIADLDSVRSLIHIGTLKLGGAQRIRDIDPLRELTSLRTLDLNETQVENIDALKPLHGLQELYLAHTPITDIDTVRQLPNLKVLVLDHTNVEDIDATRELRQLETIVLDRTAVTDINALKEVISLKKLGLADTKIGNIDALKGLKGLQGLYLAYTYVENINSLKGLLELQDLYLNNTRVKDIEALKDLKALRTLDLANTSVQNIEILKGLVGLQNLFLTNISVKDADELKAALPHTDVRF